MKPILDSRQLQIFFHTATLLNMSQVARELKITPSAVSHALSTLERELGCRLLDRSSPKIFLTVSGQQFLGEAEVILERMRVARANLAKERNLPRGQLRIGTSATACQYVLPAVLREFRESFPNYSIVVKVAEAEGAIELLKEDLVDLYLAVRPPLQPGLTFTPLAEDRLDFLMNPLHRWAQKPKIHRAEIVRQNLILPEIATETYRVIESYFREEALRIRPFIEISNEEAIKQLVRLNLGIAVFPLWMARAEIEQGLLVSRPLGRRRLTRSWGILSLKGRSWPMAHNVLVGISRLVLKALVTDQGA